MAQLHLLAVWLYGSGKRFAQHGGSLLAAGISYYVLLSIFPLLIFSAGVIGLLLQDEELQRELVDAVMNNVPLSQDEGRDEVSRAIGRIGTASSGAIGVIGLLTMAWSASAMFGAVRRSINIVSAVEVSRPFVQQKLIDLSMVLFFLPFFMASIAATTALRAAEALSDDIPVLGNWASDIGTLWWLASLALPLVFSFVAFTLLYALVPVKRPRLRHVLPGALIAAFGFELVKLGFSFYLEQFANYDVVFGSLGAVVAFMFWVYLSASIMLFGAELVSFLPEASDQARQPRLEEARPAQPLGRKIVRILKGFVVTPKS